MIMLSGPWLGASGAACAAPADTPKMKASAISLFIRFLPAFPLPHRIMAPATSRRKEGIRLFPHPRTSGNQRALSKTPIKIGANQLGCFIKFVVANTRAHEGSSPIKKSLAMC
jgi:hypothetical protein